MNDSAYATWLQQLSKMYDVLVDIQLGSIKDTS